MFLESQILLNSNEIKQTDKDYKIKFAKVQNENSEKVLRLIRHVLSTPNPAC